MWLALLPENSCDKSDNLCVAEMRCHFPLSYIFLRARCEKLLQKRSALQKLWRVCDPFASLAKFVNRSQRKTISSELVSLWISN